MRAPSCLADATAATSGAAAVASWLTPSGTAAAVAVVAGLYSIFDRWDRRRRALPEPASE